MTARNDGNRVYQQRGAGALRRLFDEMQRRRPIDHGAHETGNLRAVQLLLGHSKIESTVRYLGIEVDDALTLSEQVEL